MGVLMQAFYWDCPVREGVEHAWWGRVALELPALADTGITALWLPPVSKGMSARGMGYDPYDYYDLGDFDQKGSIPTWFGSRQALDALIATAHAQGLDVYADLVLNHCSGADAEELNPITGEMGWTKFAPASGRFPRDWNSFHPSEYESWDDASFAGFPDLCHRNPAVYREVMAYVRWLVEEVGFDGFRYDFVKGYGEEGRGTGLMAAIQEFRYRRVGQDYYKPFGVVEYWDEGNVGAIARYLDGVNFWNDNPVAAFDFPLRHRLARLCDDDAFSLRELASTGTMLAYDPMRAVTFVENHDIIRDAPIVRDKMLAYAYILTHEGYPCVFWEDYFAQGLGRVGTPGGIAALVELHERDAHGDTEVLYVDDGLYVMQRRGLDGDGGLVVAINSTRTAWRGEWVATAFAATFLTPVAYGSSLDPGAPQAKMTDGGGRVDVWAPPRGYAVYARAG
ncbi:MAG: alpha-amylase family glycosyl hydrolase [Gemmatimonadota bacterium]